MRTLPRTAAVFAAFLLIPLAGCSSSHDKPSSGMSQMRIDCKRYADTAKKITDAQTELYGSAGGADGTRAVDSLLAQLEALEKDAPADVKAALVEMRGAFEKAQRMMAHPSQEDAAALSALGPQLSKDSQKITAYVVSQCA